MAHQHNVRLFSALPWCGRCAQGTSMIMTSHMTADSNDITECQHDDRPSVGMFSLLCVYIS